MLDGYHYTVEGIIYPLFGLFDRIDEEAVAYYRVTGTCEDHSEAPYIVTFGGTDTAVFVADSFFL